MSEGTALDAGAIAVDELGASSCPHSASLLLLMLVSLEAASAP